MKGLLHQVVAIAVYLVTWLIPFAVAALILGWRERDRRDQEAVIFRDGTPERYQAFKALERRRGWLRGAGALLTFVVLSLLIDVILRDAAKIGALISGQHRSIFH